MRISDSMIFGAATLYTAKARETEATDEQQASTGARVVHAGDDPAAAGEMVAHQLNQARMNSISAGASSAGDELKTTDSALGSVNDVLIRATEIATQMANDTYNATDRASSAVEVDGLVSSMVGDLNVKFGNRYLLGGTADSAPPFAQDGTYNGNSSIRKVEIAPGVYQQSSVDAATAIGGANGGVNVIASMQALSAALKNNDPAAISAALTGLQQSSAQVSTARTSAGVNLNAFDTAVTLMGSQSDSETATISKLGDVDEVTAASNLAMAQQALNAALTATAQGFSLSLLDKIQ
jgi:flagellar hook-associated protein 3 FlgL